MKIRINIKLIILYFISIIGFSLFLKYKTFFSNFLQNPTQYIEIDKLKLSTKVSFTNNISANINLEKLDKINIITLQKHFKKALKEIESQNSYDWKDFYNIANISTFIGLEQLKNNTGDYIKSFQLALNNYNIALDNIPKYKIFYPITNNLNKTINLLNFSYVYFCSNKFIQLININEKILNLIKKIKETLKKQLKPLNKWENYPDLKKCIKGIKAEINKNIFNLYENEDFFKKTKLGILNLYKKYNKNEDLCYKEREIIDSKYKNSLESSKKYFEDFLQTQKKLLIVYEKANYFEMLYYCNNKSKLAKKQNKKNKQMQKNFQKLRDLTEKPKLRNKKKKYSEKSKNKPNQQEEKQIKNQENNIEKQMKDLIKKIQERKTQKNYNPENYIKNLFKDFYGNKKDFIEGKKINIPGK